MIKVEVGTPPAEKLKAGSLLFGIINAAPVALAEGVKISPSATLFEDKLTTSS